MEFSEEELKFLGKHCVVQYDDWYNYTNSIAIKCDDGRLYEADVVFGLGTAPYQNYEDSLKSIRNKIRKDMDAPDE